MPKVSQKSCKSQLYVLHNSYSFCKCCESHVLKTCLCSIYYAWSTRLLHPKPFSHLHCRNITLSVRQELQINLIAQQMYICTNIHHLQRRRVRVIQTLLQGCAIYPGSKIAKPVLDREERRLFQRRCGFIAVVRVHQTSLHIFCCLAMYKVVWKQCEDTCRIRDFGP